MGVRTVCTVNAGFDLRLGVEVTALAITLRKGSFRVRSVSYELEDDVVVDVETLATPQWITLILAVDLETSKVVALVDEVVPGVPSAVVDAAKYKVLHEYVRAFAPAGCTDLSIEAEGRAKGAPDVVVHQMKEPEEARNG